MARFVFPEALGMAAARYVTCPSGSSTPMTSMCSASQPSNALPPYPEPTLQISFSSGKWRISRRSGEKSPTECRPAMKSSSRRMCWIATGPTRVIRCMLATTYSLSVTMTPTRLIAEPAGPIRYGMTYIVRERMAPRNHGAAFALASAGDIQLLVGPASSRSRVQMKVSCSVRATSWGWLRCR